MLIVFLLGRYILVNLPTIIADDTEDEYIGIFACRCIVYLFSMMRFIFQQIKMSISDCRSGNVVKLDGFLPVPGYFFNYQSLEV